ncbi:MAG: hypothetical protein KA049_00175 [Burkholderiales bacterium]|nr:hypothetical protein [Burkholderiales bacterium]MBP9768007.1 hypothetical protein [Burkholderiales bacterium]
MNNKLTKLILVLTTINLAACNSGGTNTGMANSTTNTDNTQQNSTENKELNWHFSWSTPFASLAQKGLGWSIVIQNDSDYTYLAQAITGSSKINGTDTWEEDTELDSANEIAPHTTKVIYAESFTNGPKSFKLTTTSGPVHEQIITLHKDLLEANSNDFYMTNDTYHTRGEAVFNHGAKRSMATGATAAFIVADLIGLLGGAAIGEEIGNDIATRAASIAARDDLISANLFIQKANLDYINMINKETLGWEDRMTKIEDKITNQDRVNYLTQRLQSQYPKMTDKQLKLLVSNYYINRISYAIVNMRQDLEDARVFAKTYRRAIGTRTRPQIQVNDNANDALTQAIVRNNDVFKLNDLIGAVGYVASPQTIAIYRSIGGLFGAGAIFGISSTLDIAGKDRVLTSLQIDNSGIGNVGQMNDAPVSDYLVTCNNLGTESDVTVALCKNTANETQLSMLNVKLNLHLQEGIVNNNGVIQGADQYHDYCSYGYNVNGVISAVCKENSNAEAQLQQLDYAHDCADGAEVRFENNRLICSKNRYQYLDSCTPVEVQQPVDDIVTTAQCKGNNGVLREGYSSLDPKLCANGSDIINRDGTLICAQYKPEIPQGSYLNTCRVDFFDQVTTYPYSSTLAASCEDNTGYVSHITLDYLNECVAGSSVSLSSKGFLRCDRYKHYLTTDEVVNLHTQGQDMELQRLYDLGKIN